MLLTPRKTAAAVAAALLAGLAGCGQADQDNPAPSGGGEVTADNPFGVEEGSSVEAIVFDGGYGVEWVAFAGDMVEAKVGATVDVSGSTEIAQEVQPRFVGGNPPDFLDNTGSASIPPVSIVDQVVPMDELWGTANYDGIAIGDAVLPIAKQVGTVNGKFIQVPYVMTLFALWYSQSLFDENGWTPPETWDQMMNLCVEAKAQDKYLFTWGKEAANYWEWLVLDLALKEGGRDVWLNIANLQPGAWDQPAVVAAMDAVEDSVKQGCWIPGGAGTAFTDAQAAWSLNQEALFYSTGNWIEAEMADATADNFEMTAWPYPALTENGKIPFGAVQVSPDEILMVPAQSANPAGGQELLRALLSKEAATNFAKTNKAPTVVKDSVPADGFGSAALASTMKLMADAGDNAYMFTGIHTDYYGLSNDAMPVWNGFLAGEISADDARAQLQEIYDRYAADTSKEKQTYE